LAELCDCPASSTGLLHPRQEKTQMTTKEQNNDFIGNQSKAREISNDELKPSTAHFVIVANS